MGIEGVLSDIHDANGLLLVSYFGEGEWTDTAGAFDKTFESAPHVNYVTNDTLPWPPGFSPLVFIIDLETREMLAKDSYTVQLTPEQILETVQANNQ